MSESTLILRGEYRWTWCHAAEYIGGSPLVCTGHNGTPPAGLADAAGAAFAAAAAGDGGVGGAFGPGLAGAFGAGEAGDAAGGPAGEGDAFGAGETGDFAGDPTAGEGEPVFGEGGLGLAPDGAALGAGAPPCAADEAAALAAPVGGAFSCSVGERAPIFERSWPIR